MPARAPSEEDILRRFQTGGSAALNPGDVQALQRGLGNRAVQRLLTDRRPASASPPAARAPSQIQRRFELHPDTREYGWVDPGDQDAKPQGRYIWLGSYTDPPGVIGNNLDLLKELDQGTYHYTRNMFRDTPPKRWNPPYDPGDERHQDFRRLLMERERNPLTKREPVPAGDIGKMGFRFPEAEGFLWYIGSLPRWFDPDKHANVHVREIFDPRQLFEIYHNYGESPTGNIASAEPGRYVYIPARASPVDPRLLARGPSSKYIVQGQSLTLEQLDDPNAYQRLVAEVRRLDQALAPVERRQPDPDELPFRGALKGRSRGEGQVSAMGKMNAAAYALAHNLPNSETADWEWLHLRGARLGGATNSTNLVVGTFSANSAMIPIENQVLQLSKLASREYPLVVTWTAHLIRPRIATRIDIDVHAPRGLVDGNRYYQPGWGFSQGFDPINATIFDRVERDAVWEPRGAKPMPPRFDPELGDWPALQQGPPGGGGFGGFGAEGEFANVDEGVEMMDTDWDKE